MIDATNWSGKRMIEWLFNESDEFENIRAKSLIDSDLTLETLLSKVESDVMPVNEFYDKFKLNFHAAINIVKDEIMRGEITHEEIIYETFITFIEAAAQHLIIQSMASQIASALIENLESKGLTLDDINIDSINIMNIDDLNKTSNNQSNMARYN